jgi:hypothetical protein
MQKLRLMTHCALLEKAADLKDHEMLVEAASAVRLRVK